MRGATLRRCAYCNDYILVNANRKHCPYCDQKFLVPTSHGKQKITLGRNTNKEKHIILPGFNGFDVRIIDSRRFITVDDEIIRKDDVIEICLYKHDRRLRPMYVKKNIDALKKLKKFVDQELGID